MFLDSSKKLVAVLGSAKTTLNMPVKIDYVDITASTTTPGIAYSYTNGTTAVDILGGTAMGGAVPASTIRKPNGLTIYGRDTAAKNVQVYSADATVAAGAFVVGIPYQIAVPGTTNFTLIGAANNTAGTIFTATGAGTGSGTAYPLYQEIDMQLQVDDTLCFTDVQGWYTVDSQGNLKSVQAASATSIANAITTSTEKVTPVAADKVGIVDSVTGLLNWSSFTDLLNFFAALAGNTAQVFSVALPTASSHAARLEQVSLFPAVTSAASLGVFGAAGATIDLDNTTPVTCTSIANCTSAQIGSIKRIVVRSGQTWTVTASANLTIDGAASGSIVYPAGAIIEVTPTSTSAFALRTLYASATFTGTATGFSGAAPTMNLTYVRQGNVVTLRGTTGIFTGTSNATTKTVTGVPAVITPVSSQYLLMFSQDNGSAWGVCNAIIGSGGVLTFYKDVSSNPFTASGTASLAVNSVTYLTN